MPCVQAKRCSVVLQPLIRRVRPVGAGSVCGFVSPQALVDELKVRARVRLNRARRKGAAGSASLRDHLHQAAREVGFAGVGSRRGRVLGGAGGTGR